MGKSRMLSQSDIEKVSAYLDGELVERDKAILEARLKLEPELFAVLQELRVIKGSLNELPEVRIPRSFTLSSETIDSKPSVFTFPRLQFATALVGIALVMRVAAETYRQTRWDGIGHVLGVRCPRRSHVCHT